MLAAFFLLLSLAIFVGQYFIDGRRIDIFDPKNLFQVYFIIQLPLVLLIGVNLDSPGFLALSLQTADDEVLTLGSMFLMAHVTMLLSYYTIGGKWLQLPVVGSIGWDYRRAKVICTLLFIIGYLAFFYLLQINGGYTNFIENRELWRAGGMVGQGWLIFPATTMLSLAAMAYIIASNNTFRGKKGVMWVFVILGLAIFPASQMGFRGLMLLPMVQIMFIYHNRVRQLKFRKALPVLIILVLLFTGYGIYRESSFLMKDGLDLALAINFIEEHPEFIYAIFIRSKGADIVASIVRQINDIDDYMLFIPAAIETFTIAIPSALWADKPIPLSVKFSEQFFGIGGGVSPTVVGEAYWHGGVLGILLVMALLGGIFRLYKNSVRHTVKKDSSVFLFASIFPSLIMMAEAVQGYINSIFLILLLGAIMIVAFSTAKRHGGRGGESRLNC